MIPSFYQTPELETYAKNLFANERNVTRLDGWFLVKESYEQEMSALEQLPHILKTAYALQKTIKILPLSLDHNSVFAGTQRDAFAKSYALIHPSFQVSTFNGYCDPTAVFDDIEPNDLFPSTRIEAVRQQTRQSTYVSALTSVYDSAKEDTAEVAYFIEQVTGHLIPDFRLALKHGVKHLLSIINATLQDTTDHTKRLTYEAMKISLESVLLLAKRYRHLALSMADSTVEPRKTQFQYLADTLAKVPESGADNLYEAIQAFLLLWQVMCLEQAPNPFAFSVGNADRIFEPYRAKENLSREYAAALFKHFLVFFNVGDRSWAISQNIMIGGKNIAHQDLSSVSSYALLDAYFAMNLPQPILSVKLHKNTPSKLYKELGRFFFTPGCLTPSLFNDDAIFQVLEKHGYAQIDLPDYAIAGCQEPLIMGKDNGNTTNSWLNLPKILELTLNNGCSMLTGHKIGLSYEELGLDRVSITDQGILENIRPLFYKQATYFVQRMSHHANQASQAISHLPVPFLSAFMGGLESGIDTRDMVTQGTVYNGSGCLIHGLSVIGDSFTAIDSLLAQKPTECAALLKALKNNFAKNTELRNFLLQCEKFGNNQKHVDNEVTHVANNIANLVRSQKNYLGNPFRPDFATPSTHLIYGSLVGAMPSGRKATEMLNYGIDPLYGDSQLGLGFRVLSTRKLPYEQFNGGYASHMGLNPHYFSGTTFAEKGLEFRNKIMNPLFFSTEPDKIAPFYLYVNITTPATLRKVLSNPPKYAPSGVYIMRIHGTFVNFLDLSSEIQEDIIKRLDLPSTTC